MPENLLTLLNYLLIALLYLFFARVLWAVWSEVKVTKAPKPVPAPTPTPARTLTAPPAPARPAASKRSAKRKGGAGPATALTIAQPPERAGATFDVASEMTVGRAAGCQVSIPTDTYASNLHARIYQADGLTFVEDLGSTNGTFVNGARISGATAVKAGDRVQVGSTLLELS